ncbi:TonB-dependent receptor plug domain-containing protein [Sphingomonas sp.]|uniref:TonB-dependent receptor plug domain-containing protein n=1 Tax=Sphingomonas sp. TaxID=28214 RepID=UPI002BAC9FB4|nr:TonB-dependent receptor [Sphingomonas sp.]HWK36303.1 TonB-dependent receptor [Sphingomonas sp.]
MIRIPLLLAGAALALPAHAQDAPDDRDIVLTAARAAQPADQTGQAVTVITRDQIEQRQTVAIADLLATTPGVQVTRNGGIGTVTSVRIRGAESEHTLVVIDGVRVNDPSSPAGAFDFSNLLSSSVSRIEVVRGPDSVPWGSQAIGGVVNVITEAPTEGLHARASAEYGYADSVFATGGLSGRSGGLSGALTAGYLRSDGISAAANGSERDGYRQFGATGRLGLEIAPGIGIDLRGYYADSRAELDGFPPPNYMLADTPEYSRSEEIYGYAGVHADLAGGRFKNRLAFTIADINRDNYDPTYGSAPSFYGYGRSERYEYQGDFTFNTVVRAVFGAEHEDSRFTDGSVSPHAGLTSVYGELIVRPIEMLTITGGVRNDDSKDFGNHTTFSANAALALNTGTTIRASYAEGFRAPSLYERFSSFGRADLRPETAKSWDAGVEQALLDGRLRFGATVFDRNIRDRISFDSGCTFAPGVPCYVNIARTHVTGVEAGVTMRPVDGLTFAANYTWLEPLNRSPGFDGLDLQRRPRDQWSVSADYRTPFGLSLGATLLVVGDSFDDAFNTNRLDGYAIGGVRAEFPIGDRFAIYGRVDNLFDERYQTVSGYGTYRRAAYGGVRLKL